MEKSKMRRTRGDTELLREIRRCGFVYVETNGKAWVSTGATVSARQVQRLIDMGYLIAGDPGLFPDSPSQTFIPTTEKSHVQTAP